MGILTTLEKCKFEGWLVPYVSIDIRATRRLAHHYYRWISAASNEDQGRTLYTFQLNATFQDDPRFRPPLFPDTLNALREHFNAGTVGTLVIPHIGPVLCRISSWDESGSGAMTGGFNVNIGFVEEEGNRFLPVSTAVNASALEASSAALKAVRAEVLPDPPVQDNAPAELLPDNESRARDLFDVITGAADQITGLRDQSLLHGELVESKLALLTGKCREAVQSLRWLADPMNHGALAAVYDVWAAATDMVSSPANSEAIRPKVFIVDRQMTIMQVSQRIYSTTDRGGDILGLNDIPDAMAIPAGTQLRYLPEAA